MQGSFSNILQAISKFTLANVCLPSKKKTHLGLPSKNAIADAKK
jgi:hypothetical protein